MWGMMRFALSNRLGFDALLCCVLLSSLCREAFGMENLQRAAWQKERFEEDLLIRPLSDGNVMTHAIMRMVWPVSKRSRDGGGHYSVFPKAIGELVQLYGVAEFHLSFSRGQWLQSRWGHSPVPAPQGAQLHAWLHPPSGHDISVENEREVAWRGLVHSLSGLFGSSLNFLESKTSHAHPELALRPVSSLLNSQFGDSPPSSHLFYGSLPREVACTENLTPWLKVFLQAFDESLDNHLQHTFAMSEISGQAGIARLLKAGRLCGSLYSSYTTHASLECGRFNTEGQCHLDSVYILVNICILWCCFLFGKRAFKQKCQRTAHGSQWIRSYADRERYQAAQLPSNAKLLFENDSPNYIFSQLTNTVTSVSNSMPHLQSTSKNLASVRAFPQSFAAAFSFKQTMGVHTASACSLASSSWVHLHIPAHFKVGRSITFAGSGNFSETISQGDHATTVDGTVVSWNISSTRADDGLILDVTWALFDPHMAVMGLGASYVTAHRHLSSLRADRGSLVLDLANAHAFSSANVQVLDVLPWFVRVYLHTARFIVDGKHLTPLDVLSTGEVQLAGIRRGMTVIEYAITLPPNSSTTISIDFEKAFLHIDEHPPDANRGFDLPSPIITHHSLPNDRNHTDGAGLTVQACMPGAKPLGVGETCVEKGLEMECQQISRVFLDSRNQSQKYIAIGCANSSKYAGICPEKQSLCVRRIGTEPSVSDGLSGLNWVELVRPAHGLGAGLRGTRMVVTYAESVLLTVPNPDFSMPYNVITLTCTVMALFFGSIFNMLTRKLREKKPEGEKSGPKEKFSIFKLFRGKNSQGGEESQPSPEASQSES